MARFNLNRFLDDSRFEDFFAQFTGGGSGHDHLNGSTATQDGQLIPFLCECADDDCMGRIEITAWRYEDIHTDEGHYVILPGHTRIAGEKILEENSYYEIVKKAA